MSFRKHLLAFLAVLVVLSACGSPSAAPASNIERWTGFLLPGKTSAASTATAAPTSESYEVRLHPEGGLYVGDLVSFEVISPAGEEMQDRQVEITIEMEPPQTLGPQAFGGFGIAGRSQATLRWAWDTGELGAGEYTIHYSILPDGISWEQTVSLLPAEALPRPEAESELASVSTDCCLLYYLTNTAAERDLAALMDESERITDLVAGDMGIALDEQITIILMPRVLGHGGFASSEIYVSYLDRNYAGNNFRQVLRHETVHVLDADLGGSYRPTLFVEGLAVYLSGGHFKPEPLQSRAATLLELGWYLPLGPLADDFYFQQHEIGYLQAGALVEYMVETWGYAAFDTFYRDIQLPVEGQTPADVIDLALQDHFGMSFAQLEGAYLNSLRRQPLNPDLIEDTRLTVQFFDTVRRYQRALDPSAYFLTAWLVTLPDIEAHEAEYLRHPSEVENLTLEIMLAAAEDFLWQGKFLEVQYMLGAINYSLEALENGEAEPLGAHPLTDSYAQIVMMLLAEGYTPLQVVLGQEDAQVLVSMGDAGVIWLELDFEDQTWQVQ